MMKVRLEQALFLFLLVAIPGCTSVPTHDVKGSYRFEDRTLISIRQDRDELLRYRIYQTGESGRLEAEREGLWVSGKGFRDTSPVVLTVRFELDSGGRATGLIWDRKGEAPRRATRINREEEVRFRSGDTDLAGRLYLPQTSGPHPAVVIVHGSGQYAATDVFYDGDFLAPHGVATLVYDKRGTGGSGASDTFDFNVLANDVVAAVDFLSGRPDIDANRIGLVGHSQGGWVGPLAASRTDKARFVVVNFGLIESPAEEARMEMLDVVRGATRNEEELARARALIDSAIAIVASNFEEGWTDFEQRVKVSKDERWFKALRPTPIGELARYPRWLVRFIGPRKAPPGMSWHYSSEATLERLSVPMLWILGEKDRSAPNEKTIPKLRALAARGRPVDLIVLPGTDHTGLLFTESGGHRVSTRYYPDYFRTHVGWIVRMLGAPDRSR